MDLNPVHLGAFFGLIVLAIWAWKKHRSYDLQDFEPIVKRKYQ